MKKLLTTVIAILALWGCGHDSEPEPLNPDHEFPAGADDPAYFDFTSELSDNTPRAVARGYMYLRLDNPGTLMRYLPDGEASFISLATGESIAFSYYAVSEADSTLIAPRLTINSEPKALLTARMEQHKGQCEWLNLYTADSIRVVMVLNRNY